MEIGSMGAMTGMMGMQGGMQRPPKPDADEMSADFIDALDGDGDGQLSEAEFTVEGTSDTDEVFDILDTNEDGFVSQDELRADMESRTGSANGQLPPPQAGGPFAGISQNGDSESMQALMDMVGGASGDQAQAAEQYDAMQSGTFGGFNDQALYSSLSLSA